MQRTTLKDRPFSFDHHASEGANPAIVNDLDLTVTAPNGNTYKGNVFTGKNTGYSAPNTGSYDRRNVEENVLILKPNAQVGEYKIKISAYNVPNGENGKQPFALVVTGGLPTPSVPAPNSPRFIRLKVTPESTPQSGHNLTLNWTAPKGGASVNHYHIYATSKTMWDGSFAFDFTTPSAETTALSYTFNNVVNNNDMEQRYYCVKAVNASGKESKSSVVVGAYTKLFKEKYDSFSLPLIPFANHSADWYCDEIPMPDSDVIYEYDYSKQGHSGHLKSQSAGQSDFPVDVGRGFLVFRSEANPGTSTTYTFISKQE